MPSDALFISALARELSRRVTGGRIEKIQQPSRDEVLLTVRGERLLISSVSGSSRVSLTEARFENPSAPPMFCMLLRKHLTGAKIKAVRQPERERMVVFDLEAADAMGEYGERKLVIELFGRFSNVILLDGEDKIIDCLHRLPGDGTEKRCVLPGLYYRMPQAQDRPLSFLSGASEIREAVMAAPGEMLLEKWMLSVFAGVSPLFCREAAFRACADVGASVDAAREEDGERLLRIFSDMFSSALNGDRFVMLSDEKGMPRDFYCLDIDQYGEIYEKTFFDSPSAVLDAFYLKRDAEARARRRTQSLAKNVRNLRDRTARRVAAQTEELKAAGNRDELRRAGDMITANLYRMQKGMTVLRAEDFYEEGSPEREIRLDPLKTPQQNAAAYYKDYNRAKTAERMLSGLVEQGNAELAYLDAVLGEIALCETERDVAEIRQELEETGILKTRRSGKKEKRTEQKPMRFISSTGMEILAGRNNLQNDRLTFRDAMRRDVWLHVQRAHGSHVVIRTDGGEPDRATLEEAACIAVYYSQARDSGSTAVDYTLVRNVRRRPGGKPGMVFYTDYATVYVSADGKTADRLRTQ